MTTTDTTQTPMTTPKGIYISGPMTGIKELNRPTFDKAAQIINAIPGCRDHNPATLDYDGQPKTYRQALTAAIKMLLNPDVQAIAFLPGYNDSKGALVEMMIAASIEIETYTLDPNEPNPTLNPTTIHKLRDEMRKSMN